mgnify:CR=1 FL=1|jgi:hypothetical protein
MDLNLPFNLKIHHIIKNGSGFEGKVTFRGREYSIVINAQKNEKIISVPFPVIGIDENEILVRLSGKSGMYVQDHVKFKGRTKILEISSNIIFQEIANNKIKFDTIEVFVK